jgi:hypothetical protein
MRSDELAYKVAIQAEKQGLILPGNLLDIRIHDLCQSFGSYHALTGTSFPILGKNLGHKSQQATQIYARRNLDPVRASAEMAVDQMFRKGWLGDLIGQTG